MSLEPGQIVGQDLSPNANILGTQIADKTLLFRNFSEDVFKIVSTGTASVTVGSGDTANDKQTIVAHGLGFTPIVIAFIQNPTSDIQNASGEILCPFAIYGDTTTGSHPTVLLPMIQYYYAGADSTNVYFNVLSSDVTFYLQLQNTFHFKYYLLQETASV